MTREQMLAWLALEGWELIYCAANHPAFLKGVACVYTNAPWSGHKCAPNWMARYNDIWNKDGCRRIISCSESEYSDEWIRNAFEYITKEGL